MRKLFNSLPRALKSPSSLQEKALLASVWTTVNFGGQRALQLVSNLILTRILFPETFGLMALVTVFHIGIHMLSDVGIKNSLIRHERGGEDEFINTVWTLQIIRGTILSIALAVIAYPISFLYQEPQLGPILLVTAVVPFMGAFQSIDLTLAERKFKQGKLTIHGLAGQFISISVTIVLAIQLKSAWALAYGFIFGTATNVALSYLLFGEHKHKLTLHKESVSDIFSFGRWIFFGTLFSYLGGNGLKAIQGALVTTKILGLIHISEMISMIATQLIEQMLAKVVYPVLSHINRDAPSKFINVLKTSRVKVIAFTLPIYCSVSLSAKFIIDLLYDDRYKLAGSFLAIQSIASAFTSQPMLYQNALLAKGESKMHFYITTASAVIKVLGILIGHYYWGILGMLASLPLSGFTHYLIMLVCVYKRGWVSWKLEVLSTSIICLVIYINFRFIVDVPVLSAL